MFQVKIISNNNRQGFTLIETFGAITILILAVLGPLSLLATNITEGVLIKNQMVANYLAQEGVELVIRERNQQLKDSNTNGNNWLGPLAGCTESNPCNIDPVDFTVISCGGDCQVYAQTETIDIGNDKTIEEWVRFFATDDGGRVPTIFKRSIYLDASGEDFYSPVSEPIDPDIPDAGSQSYFNGSERARVVVTVDWQFKGLPKTYSLATYIYNLASLRPIEEP